jgi:hypothetical protein
LRGIILHQHKTDDERTARIWQKVKLWNQMQVVWREVGDWQHDNPTSVEAVTASDPADSPDEFAGAS